MLWLQASEWMFMARVPVVWNMVRCSSTDEDCILSCRLLWSAHNQQHLRSCLGLHVYETKFFQRNSLISAWKYLHFLGDALKSCRAVSLIHGIESWTEQNMGKCTKNKIWYSLEEIVILKLRCFNLLWLRSMEMEISAALWSTRMAWEGLYVSQRYVTNVYNFFLNNTLFYVESLFINHVIC